MGFKHIFVILLPSYNIRLLLATRAGRYYSSEWPQRFLESPLALLNVLHSVLWSLYLEKERKSVIWHKYTPPCWPQDNGYFYGDMEKSHTVLDHVMMNAYRHNILAKHANPQLYWYWVLLELLEFYQGRFCNLSIRGEVCSVCGFSQCDSNDCGVNGLLWLAWLNLTAAPSETAPSAFLF